MKDFPKRRVAPCLPVVFCIALGSWKAEAQQRAERRPVTWVNSNVPQGPGLEHKVLASRVLGHDVGYVVWTPEDYEVDSEARYPVIYFLHGLGGTESADAGGFSALVRRGIREGIIPPSLCVFPNGGRSFYRGAVEVMIVDELIPLIDRAYRTKSEGASRAVAGFSMGGAGAVYLALRHPELFCAAGSWGGGMFGGAEPFLDAAQTNAASLKQNSIAMLLVNGDNDRPDAFAALAETLSPLGIPHEIMVLEDTDHNLGLYYDRAGDHMAGFLGSQLRLGLTE